jgi:beta-N-acetylhexosaminidase
MNAISSYYDLSDALSLTINSGSDMIIFGNQLGSITAPQVIDQIELLVENGVIDRERIDESYQRIALLKRSII